MIKTTYETLMSEMKRETLYIFGSLALFAWIAMTYFLFVHRPSSSLEEIRRSRYQALSDRLQSFEIRYQWVNWITKVNIYIIFSNKRFGLNQSQSTLDETDQFHFFLLSFPDWTRALSRVVSFCPKSKALLFKRYQMKIRPIRLTRIRTTG